MIGNFTESQQFKPIPKNTNTDLADRQASEQQLLDYVLANAEKGNPQSCINTIDQFCEKTWMMNLGYEKAKIVIHYLKQKKPLKMLQIGSYCGYSSLVLIHNSPQDSQLHCIEISQYCIGIAKQIHQFAGISKRVHFHLGTVQQNIPFFKQHGAFDFIFIDHDKKHYLSDFKLIEETGGVAKGTVVVGDNMIRPGAPDYVDYFKKQVIDKYKSTLYHSYVQYSSVPDAVLVSHKL